MRDAAGEGTPLTHPALRHCVALLRLRLASPSLAAAKQVHARALRAGVPPSHPLLAKHLLFHLASLRGSPPPPLRYAVAVLSRLLPDPDPFSLNTVLRIAASSHRPRLALALHRRRLAPPDTHTYPPLLQACARLLALREGERIHAEAAKNGLLAALVYVKNSLVHLYGACGLFESAHRVFEEIPVRERNLVSWNSALNGFAANGRPNEVLTIFREMLDVDFTPDGFTMVSVLTACAEIAALALGRRVHVYVTKVGLVGNSHCGNALIDLYAKCGCVDDARRVFEEMGTGRTVVSWTSLIVGLAVSGFGKEALELFSMMEREKLVPTEITMVGVLYACSHCGLVDDGFMYFDRMKEYGIVPRIEHMGCMVDLLGRAGKVEEAYDYIITMPLEPNAVVWRTLLGACAMHKKLELGEAAWARLVELDPGHSGDYVLLSNLYAAVGRWADVHMLRKTMVKNRVRKNPGRSLVELRNSVYEFVMGDRSHPESEQIYQMLAEIAEKLRREGYIPRTSNVLADIEEEEKETALNYHSERLAIAFALLKSLPGIPIRIVKNLRVCGDCHTAIKLISKVYDREIIVRDRSRFHHFKGGTCSCKDYW
ncbi:hypothetical protein ACP4OV_012119 [Aristida adscensionis]